MAEADSVKLCFILIICEDYYPLIRFWHELFINIEATTGDEPSALRDKLN